MTIISRIATISRERRTLQKRPFQIAKSAIFILHRWRGRIRYRMASASKQIQLLFERDGPWCHFCGYEIRIRNPMNNEQESPTRDHIVPKALGGKTTLENLRLAHKFCNSVRALGFERGHKNHPKYLKFLDRLAAHGYFFNPNFTGPASHGLSECPKHLLPKEKVWSKTAFFTIGPLAFDIRFTPGRYSHLRVSLGSKHLTGMGYIKE